jgi:hypothetical protein
MRPSEQPRPGLITAEVGIAHVGLKQSIDLCRLTSRILKTLAPRRAAEVRKPERRLWGPIVLVSRPESR